MRGLPPAFPRIRASFGRLVRAVFEDEGPQNLALEPRRRLLPLTAEILNGRRAMGPGGAGSSRAVVRFATAVVHLALLAYPEDEPLQRLRSFGALQLRRFEAYQGRKPRWWETSPGHCFDRALANAVSVAYEIDGRGDPDRIAHQAADCANYLVCYVHLSGHRLDLGEEPADDEGWGV